MDAPADYLGEEAMWYRLYLFVAHLFFFLDLLIRIVTAE